MPIELQQQEVAQSPETETVIFIYGGFAFRRGGLCFFDFYHNSFHLRSLQGVV